MRTCARRAFRRKAAVADFRGDKGPFKGLSDDLQQTLASARDAMADLAENTEALKRNFFFRGFFNKRGYFDLQDVSVQQYREGALETQRPARAPHLDRHAGPVRANGCNGEERLSDGGQDAARFGDVAVPQISQEQPCSSSKATHATGYPRRTIPAQPCAGELVRDYLVTKFGLDTNYVATMPLGSEATDSPDGANVGRGGAGDIRGHVGAIELLLVLLAGSDRTSAGWHGCAGMAIDT